MEKLRYTDAKRVGALLTTIEQDVELDEVAIAILGQLKERGALFANEIERGLSDQYPGLSMMQFQAALWSLVWASLITNDTFAPLREMRRRFAAHESPHSQRTLECSWRWSQVHCLRSPRSRLPSARWLEQ